jgi:geranylgeranyl transferase type-2 subunit beta
MVGVNVHALHAFRAHPPSATIRVSNYLEDLTLRLAAGMATLPDQWRARHSDYLRAAQREEGGFAGRQGASDLYYTSFGLRGLALLGELDDGVAERAASFLRGRLRGQESVVDFFALLYSAFLLEAAAGIDLWTAVDRNWRDAVASFLETLRRPDGGYAKALDGAASSTYHTFLVLLCRQLLDRPPPEPEAIALFLRSQQMPEGGFREIRASQRAGTNPTAAAIGALQILGQLDASIRSSTIDFLVEMQTDEGGLRANTRIPIADLLSTFTGLVTLDQLGAARELDLPAVRRFAWSLALPEGGFRAAEWDTAHDVEYTFYGLGTLGLLAHYE